MFSKFFDKSNKPSQNNNNLNNNFHLQHFFNSKFHKQTPNNKLETENTNNIEITQRSLTPTNIFSTKKYLIGYNTPNNVSGSPYFSGSFNIIIFFLNKIFRKFKN